MSLIRWSRTSDIYIFNHVNGLYCLMLRGTPPQG